MPSESPLYSSDRRLGYSHVAVVVWAGLAAIAAAALVRAVWMGLTQAYDFEIVYTSARAWRLGVDAYDPYVFRVVWETVPGAGPRDFRPDEATSLYPAATYVLLSPITWLPLPIAKAVWVLLNVAALGAGVVATTRWMQRTSATAVKRTVFCVAVAVMLLWAMQTHFRFGQTAIVSVGLTLAALALWEDVPSPKRWRWWLAAVAAGCAVALKPQLAVPLLGYGVLRRWWAGVSVAIAFAGLLMVVGVGWMAGHGHDAMAGLMRNVSRVAEAGFLSPMRDSAFRYQLVNFHLPLHGLTDNAALVAWLVRATVGALALVVAACVWFRPRTTDALAALSAIAALSLMLTYHRGYDAVVLLPAVAWCVRAWLPDSATPRRDAWITLLLLLPMATPGGTLMHIAEQRGAVSAALSSTWMWNAVAVPYQAWTVAALAVWFTWQTWATASGSTRRTSDATQRAA